MSYRTDEPVIDTHTQTQAPGYGNNRRPKLASGKKTHEKTHAQNTWKYILTIHALVTTKLLNRLILYG